jgi:hypothetical protein
MHGTNMDTNVDIRVLIKPIWFDRFPTCRIGINDELHELVLVEPTWVNLKHSGSNATLKIEHYGKTNADTNIKTNEDTAIVVEQIHFNEITSPKFIWQGIYYPSYPQHVSGESELKFHNYLGWNGVWCLDFTLPIYTWIHQVEDLGWIYD